ncbi:hypothetical protein QVD17_12637 [Tagetes erecta]|uniref:Uncharacterized protein n=1 Tax=Tagetes erecta TaxID=13708 RepID=A0AAD8P2U7_TARER|nr:hypothetical protein QVD17_12637 [Tagetes erecta]
MSVHQQSKQKDVVSSYSENITTTATVIKSVEKQQCVAGEYENHNSVDVNLKRNLRDIYDVDDPANVFNSKARPATISQNKLNSKFKLLTPKIEK